MVEDIRKDVTHQEVHPEVILSELATQIPFLCHNQSPRNMYQCQMGKQTMGTAYHNHPYRADKKMYKITNPQLPLVRCNNFEQFGFNEYPSGTNAIVAVISYTGYDIEDAMIINKSAYERGFGHGCIYKTVNHQLNAEIGNSGKHTNHVKMLHQVSKSEMPKQQPTVSRDMDQDGLTNIGSHMAKGKAEMSTYDSHKTEIKKKFFKDNEKAFVDQVNIISQDNSNSNIDISIKYRIPRNPTIGDKFSSRHGQKGV